MSKRLQNVKLPESIVNDMMDEFNEDAKKFSETYVITLEEFILKIKEEYGIVFENVPYEGFKVVYLPETYSQTEEYKKELEYGANRFLVYNNIDYPEYIRYVHEYIIRSNENERILKEVFNELDKNGDGFLDEPMLFIKMLNPEISDGEATRLLKRSDVDSDGKINYPEYVYLVMNINTL